MKPQRKIGYIYETDANQSADDDPGKGILIGVGIGITLWLAIIVAIYGLWEIM